MCVCVSGVLMAILLSVQLRVIQSGVEQLTEHVAMSLKLLDKLGEGHNNTGP